jgi:signal transduction histidine kinase/ligand-binding sensor domain-containing protein
LGTLNGLARFDGVDFTVFDENNTPGLKSSRIVGLFEDSRTNLWVGTETTGILLIENGKVNNLGLGRLAAICEDTNQTVWLYTSDGDLCRYRDKTGDIWHDGSAHPSVHRALIPGDSGLLLVGTDTNITTVKPMAALAQSALPVESEQAIGHLDLLLASKRAGFWCLADRHIQRRFENRIEKDWEYPWTNSVPVAACEDLEGNLVVGTYGDGVYWFDNEGNWTKFSGPEGLSHSSVLSVIVDREGSLWVGTNGGGLNRIRKLMFTVIEETRGLTVQSVCEDAKGTLWVAYNGARINARVGDDWQKFGLPVLDPSGLYVKSIFLDEKQRVLAGAWTGQGPNLFHLQDGWFQPIPGWTRGNRDVSAIFQDRKGVLWVGTQLGLASWDEHAWKFFTTRDGLSANQVRAIADSADGDIWIGTDGGGLNRLHAGKFTAFGKTNGLPSDNISSLYLDRDGVLWAGTSSGLIRYENGAWTIFSRREGLVSENVGYLVEDGQGYLWIGSNAGLMRVKKQSLNDFAAGKLTSIALRTYGEPDGLLSGECTFGSQPGGLRTRSGELLFPTIKGLASLDPAQLYINTNPPLVVIESISIDGQVQGSNLLRAPFPQSVTIPAGKEALDIKFTSLNLAAPDRGRFRYRLAGYEKAWQEAAWNIRQAHYIKVQSGDYTFQVKACNEDGVWNDIGSSLALVVLPPFWQTWWFLLAASVCLLGMVVGSVHYVSTQKLQRQLFAMRQQEALEKERARIARDLHDQLGANLTQVALLGEMAEADKDIPDEVVSHAQQICQTARDTTRALDEIVWTVNPSNDTLEGLVNYICKYAQDYLGVAGLRYRLDVPSQLPPTPISPELRHNVFLASKEAITNVVKHARASAATLRLRLEPNRFTLEIQDDGRGLAGLNQDAAKLRNGMKNMRKRMEDVGGDFAFESAPEGGAVVRLTGPLESNKTPAVTK